MTSKRIYLAARYSRREEMLSYAEDIWAMGHTVTSRWINGSHQVDNAGLSTQADPEERERFAREDLEDLLRCDICISFTEEPRTSNSRGGRHVEFGIAYAKNKTCIVVGPRENVFHCLPKAHVYDEWPDVANKLRDIFDVPEIKPTPPSQLETAGFKENDYVAYKDRVGRIMRFRQFSRWVPKEKGSRQFTQAMVRWNMSIRPHRSWVDLGNLLPISKEQYDERGTSMETGYRSQDR